MNKIILLTVCVLVAVGVVLFIQVGDKPDSVVTASNRSASPVDSDAAQHSQDNPPSHTAPSKTSAQQPSTAEQNRVDSSPASMNDTPQGSSTDAEHSAWFIVDEEPIQVDGVKGLAIHTDPTALTSIQVGQTIILPIPDLQPVPEAMIESAHSPLAGIDVFKGPLNAGQAGDNVIVTRGEIDTIFVVSTSTGVYTAIVNNRTGQGSLVNEADVNARAVPIADGIEVAPVEMPLPERGQGS